MAIEKLKQENANLKESNQTLSSWLEAYQDTEDHTVEILSQIILAVQSVEGNTANILSQIRTLARSGMIYATDDTRLERMHQKKKRRFGRK